MEHKLRGVIPPLATPFKDQALDLAAFRQNLKAYNQTGLSGYLALGSNGEAAYLNDKEKEELLAACREEAAEGKLFLAGAGCETTADTIRICKTAAKHGADYALVYPPNYYKSQMSLDRQYRHFDSVCQASPIPVLYYNVPAATGLNASADMVEKLAQIPNLVGIKDSSGNMAQLSEITRRCGDGFRTFVGASPMLYPGMCLGAHGGILAVANAAPKTCVKLFEAFCAGDHARALELHRLLYPLAFMVTGGYGVPGLKYAMELLGLAGGEVRAPLTALDDQEAMRKIKAEVEKVAQVEKS